MRVEERKGSGRGVEDVLVARTRVVDSLALALPWLCCSPREWEAREAAEEEGREGKKRGRKREGSENRVDSERREREKEERRRKR